jgi:hypothetical protein
VSTLNVLTGKKVNPGVIEHLNVKNVKNYIGCERLVFFKLKTIHPFSIALLSAKKATYIGMCDCGVYNGIGKDLATLQVDFLNVGNLKLKVEDVVELLQSKTVFGLELPMFTFLKATDKEIELIEDAFNQFKGKVDWRNDGHSIAKLDYIKLTNPRLLRSVDYAGIYAFSGRGDSDRMTGQYVTTIEVVKAVEAYPLISTKVIAQTLVLSSLIAIDATTEALKGYKALMSVSLGGEEKDETKSRVLEVLSYLDELFEAPTPTSSSMFTDEAVNAVPPDLLNAFFISKGCDLSLDIYITTTDIDQATFEALTNRTVRKLYAASENLDVTSTGKNFKLLKRGDACVTLREVKLKDKSQAYRIGEMIKTAAGICDDKIMQQPFEVNIAHRDNEIEYDSFVPILEAIDEVNKSRMAGKTKLAVGCTKVFSIKIPAKCYMNNKLVKTIKDFIKDNRSSSVKIAQQAIDTGVASKEVLVKENNYGPGGNYFCINLYG